MLIKCGFFLHFFFWVIVKIFTFLWRKKVNKAAHDLYCCFLFIYFFIKQREKGKLFWRKDKNQIYDRYETKNGVISFFFFVG